MKILSKISAAQWGLAGLIVALALGQIFYQLLVIQQLRQTAALFIGLPALIAVAVTLTPKAKSATGMILKGLTIAMLLSGIFLQEGFICIVMVSPLFYGVGALVGLAIDYTRRRDSEIANKRVYSLLIIPLLLMSLEGVTTSLSFSRDEVVTVSRIVSADPAAVAVKLSQDPQFDRTLPSFLRLGFPTPIAGSGSGLALGSQRAILFSNGNKQPGQLVFEIIEQRANRIRFRAVSDSTEIAQWLTWQEAEVSWVELANGKTQVTWSLHYQRRLEPGLVFWSAGTLRRWFNCGLSD